MDTDQADRTAVPLDSLISSWVFASPWPMAVIDQELALLWLNAAARAELETGKSLRLDGDRLTLGSEEEDEALKNHIETCGEREKIFARANGGKEIFLLRSRMVGEWGSRRAAGIRFYRPEAPPALDHPPFAELFGLTPAEERVLHCLLNGRTVDSTAAQLGKSQATVRKHVDHIYQKMDVSSREALFATVRSLY